MALATNILHSPDEYDCRGYHSDHDIMPSMTLLSLRLYRRTEAIFAISNHTQYPTSDMIREMIFEVIRSTEKKLHTRWLSLDDNGIRELYDIVNIIRHDTCRKLLYNMHIQNTREITKYSAYLTQLMYISSVFPYTLIRYDIITCSYNMYYQICQTLIHNRQIFMDGSNILHRREKTSWNIRYHGCCVIGVKQIASSLIIAWQHIIESTHNTEFNTLPWFIWGAYIMPYISGLWFYDDDLYRYIICEHAKQWCYRCGCIHQSPVKRSSI